MKNVRRFVRHAKKITLSGNIQYCADDAYLPYSRYQFRKKREEITRTELLDAYFMVTRWLCGDDLILKVDDKTLKVLPSEIDESVNFVDVETGEVMLTLDFGQEIYTTEWASDLYKWGK